VILLDTTVLVYAHGTDHPLKARCSDVLGAVSRGELEATTTVEVIQEFAYVYARRGRTRATAVARARDLRQMLTPLISPTEGDLDSGLGNYANGDIGCFDAVLAATARRLGATLVSADRAFAGIDGLSCLDPGSPTFLDELGIGFSGEEPGR
jgi:predicted nucleic acid-binding protein